MGVMQPCRAALVLWFERVRGNGHWRAAYNACGVRIREHPVTKDAILAGLREKGQLVIALKTPVQARLAGARLDLAMGNGIEFRY